MEHAQKNGIPSFMIIYGNLWKPLYGTCLCMDVIWMSQWMPMGNAEVKSPSFASSDSLSDPVDTFLDRRGHFKASELRCALSPRGGEDWRWFDAWHAWDSCSVSLNLDELNKWCLNLDGFSQIMCCTDCAFLLCSTSDRNRSNRFKEVSKWLLL
jgi:hypothetical protein